MTKTKHFIYSDLTFIAATAMMALAAPGAEAYDFSAINDSGKRIYYNILSDTDIEVTYQELLSPTYTYSGVLDIPQTVTYWGKEMRVTAIGDRAFFGCRSLKELHLPPTVKTIGQWGFGWCDSIASIELPASVERIGADAFDGCYGLQTIMVDGSNSIFQSRQDAVFTTDGRTLQVYRPTAEGIADVPEGTEMIAPRAFGGCTFIDSVRIASTVRSIGREAFSFCHSLRSISVPASVEEIGENAMSDCFTLERIVADSAGGHFSSYDGALYSHDYSALLQSPGARTNLNIHPKVKEIKRCALLDCHGLIAIMLPDSVANIGEAAFAGCGRLESVVIPEGVRSIGSMAFGLCDSLRNVYSLSAEPRKITVGEGAFSGVPQWCTLFVPRGSRQAYASAEGWNEIANIEEVDALLPQTISWVESENRRIGDGCIELGAAASSGLPVKYVIASRSEGAAAVEGNVLKVLSKGAVYVTAYQLGNASFLPAEPVTLAFNDPTGVEDVEAGDDLKVYGGKGEIIIEGADEGDIAEVYDINGVKVYSGSNRYIKVAGMKVYMVRIGGRIHKVVVR